MLKATAMIKNRYPREWIVRQLQRFQGLSPGKGNWGPGPIRTQILREVDGATGDRTLVVVGRISDQNIRLMSEKSGLSYCTGVNAGPVCQ